MFAREQWKLYLVSVQDTARGMLRSEGWLSRMPERFRETVLSKTVVKRFEPGATVVTAGEEPRGLFGVAEGGLRVSIAPDDSGPFFAHFFQPGSWFGEAPAITARHYLIGLVAARESTLVQLPTHALNEILREDPAAWRYLAQLAVEHMEIAIGFAADMMRRDHTRRFAAILTRLGGCRAPTHSGVKLADIDYSQEDLAAMTNLARTTVNGVLNQLQEKGVVDLNYRRIRILDPDKLRAMIAD
ncbi:MAG: Crp/Fnr family transcriptional regulator [Beijerinckiaceae bacterium]|nr:Crp/Fnr family transcriptional regulator [Beijerinckiaceae bacterium]